MKRLLLDGFEVDLDQDIALPITYAISDIKKPQGRKQSLSKQSTLRGTARNMRFFQSVYSLSATSEYNNFQFDPTRKVVAELYDDIERVFKGFFKIDEVTYHKKEYLFKFTIYSNVLNFYKDLQQMYLTDLDFSKYDHDLTNTNIANSWNTSVVVNGTPTANFTGSAPDGFGYLYGFVDNGQTRTAYNEFLANQIVPQVYFKEAFQLMMEAVGVNYSFSLETNNAYKRVMIGGVTGALPTIDATEINNRKVDISTIDTPSYPILYLGAGSGGVKIYKTTKNIEMFIGGATINQDIYGQYNPPYVYIVRNGSYNYTYTINGTFSFSHGAGVDVVQNNYVWGEVDIFINGVFNNRTFIVATSPTTFTCTFSAPATFVVGDLIQMRLLINFQSNFTVVAGSALFTQTATINFSSLTSSFILTAVSAPVAYGDTVSLSAFLPKIKCSDIFDAIIKLANCYFEMVDDVLVITPFIDFYEGTADAEDWSDKVNYLEPLKIKSANFIEGKTYKFKYTDDVDYYNKLYFDQTGRNYGDKKLEVNSPFKQEEVTFTLPFSQTVLVQQTGQPLILPTIISVDNGIVKPFKGKPRIYLYSGLRTGAIKVEGTSYASYPQLGHFLDVDNPIYDLNFDLPDKVYYTLGSITNNNAFNLYHSKFFNENTNKDSKQLNLSVKLSPKDIANLSFSKLKNIDGVLYRLNEVLNVDTVVGKTFECELIKVIDADSNTTYTGLPSPSPSLDVSSTMRLMNTPLETSSNFRILDGGGTYLGDSTSGVISGELFLKISNQTVVVMNVGTANYITIVGTVGGVTNPKVYPSKSITIYFKDSIYYKINEIA